MPCSTQASSSPPVIQPRRRLSSHGLCPHSEYSPCRRPFAVLPLPPSVIKIFLCACLLRFYSSARAASAMAGAVKPKWSMRRPPGALAPNRFIVTVASA